MFSGSWVSKLILYGQTVKLSFALRSSCQTAEWSNFCPAASSYSDSGLTHKTLYSIKVDQEIFFVNHYAPVQSLQQTYKHLYHCRFMGITPPTH